MTADKYLLKMMMHSKTYFDWSKASSFYISQWTPLSQFQERRSTVLRLYDFLPPPDPEKDEAAKAAARCPAASQVALHLSCRSMQEVVRSGLGGKTRLVPVLDVCLQTSAVLNVFLLRPTVEVCIQIVTANEIMVLRRSRKILGVLPGCMRQFTLLYAWKDQLPLSGSCRLDLNHTARMGRSETNWLRWWFALFQQLFCQTVPFFSCHFPDPRHHQH